jgi:hypothetical protein
MTEDWRMSVLTKGSHPGVMESGAIAIFIALITVSVQSLRAALANPIESLRDD